MSKLEDITNSTEKELGDKEEGKERNCKPETPEEAVGSAEKLVSAVDGNTQKIEGNLKSVGKTPEVENIGRENKDLVVKAEEGLDDFKTEIEAENDEPNLSNDDLLFFMHDLRIRNLEQTNMFLFAQSELKEQLKNDVDYDSVEFFKERVKKDENISEKDLKDLRGYSDEKLVNNLNNYLAMMNKAVKEESAFASDMLIDWTEEEIEEARNSDRRIDQKVVDGFQKNLNDLKEKIYFVSVVGILNVAYKFAKEFQNSGDEKFKEAAGNWVMNAREEENKNLDKINKFDLAKIDEKIVEICNLIGIDGNKITREWFQEGEEDHRRLGAIHKVIMEKMPDSSGEAKTSENFMSQFKDGEEVYNYLTSEYDITELWKLTDKSERGELVDMMIDFAMENNMSKEEIIKLIVPIEPFEHIGRGDTYKWLMINGGDEEDLQVEERLVQTGEENNSESQESEDLSVDEIVEKINNGEKVGEVEEMKLRKAIEEVVLTKDLIEESKEDWTEEEGKMMAAYMIGVKKGWFEGRDIKKFEFYFDFDNVKFNNLKTDAEKMKVIENRKKDAGEKLIEQGVVKKADEIDADVKILKKGLQDNIVEERAAYEAIVDGQSAEELFNEKGKGKMKEIIEHLKNSNQIELNLERLEYYNMASDDGKIDFMIKEHHIQKDYMIRMLEQSLLAFDEVTKLLDKEEEELTEPERNILAQIADLMKEKKLPILAVVALLAGLGLIAVYGPGIYAGVAALAGDEIVKEIVKETVRQAVEQKVGNGLACVGAGAVVGGAGLIAAFYALFDEEKRDKLVELLTGKPVPGYASSKQTGKA